MKSTRGYVSITTHLFLDATLYSKLTSELCTAEQPAVDASAYFKSNCHCPPDDTSQYFVCTYRSEDAVPVKRKAFDRCDAPHTVLVVALDTSHIVLERLDSKDSSSTIRVDQNPD